ncbi:IS6 family transposase [Halobacterium salinarum]|uniref:IS6 family transposase n=1 Tax=Halobacterium salinarum TaxID=2242 RepID=UPI002552C008|nr:IS6 family transposase [Halobacterium salinarum]MDL0123106.1 IS6 family transposase [Halobacterium salinarum]MDL0131402.1 IS6 family transposase [Halobacterium salinarum]
MTEFDRLKRGNGWVDLTFVERERTPREIIEVGIQLHIAGISLSNTKQFLERLGVERSRTAIHNWVQKTDVQPSSDAEPNHIAVDETVIQLNAERHWLYAAVDPATNEFLHVRLFQTRTTDRTLLFLRELSEKIPVEQATFLVDAAHHLKDALTRLGFRFQVRRHGNRNAVERVFREIKRRTSSFSNTFSHVKLPTAESWLQTFAVWWNHC